MSVVWNIVWKDFRRLAGPLGLWLLLVVAHVGLLFVWEGHMGRDAAALEGKRHFVNTCGGIVIGVGFILAAWLVMEDNLVSTQAFWRTRAISGGRLLAGKVLAALLMFSVSPVLVLTPVWLGCGFSLREIAHAGFEWGGGQAMVSLGAFALGSITATSKQFLMRLVAAVLLIPPLTLYAMSATPFGENETRFVVLAVMAWLLPVAVVWHQFLTRRTGRTWLMVGTGVVVMLVTGRYWQWDLVSPSHPYSAQSGAPGAGLAFTSREVEANFLGNSDWMKLEGQTMGIERGTHVRVDAVQCWWLAGGGPKPGPKLKGFLSNGDLATESLRHAAGLAATPPDQSAWRAIATTMQESLRRSAPGTTKMGGVVEATVLQGKVLGELPLRAGATLDVGSSHIRIKSIEWIDGNVRVLVEERFAWVTADFGRYRHSHDQVSNRIRAYTEGFVIVHRRRGLDAVPRVQELGTINADSIVVGRQYLVVDPTVAGNDSASDWLTDAVLVKVRFVPKQKIVQSLTNGPFAIAGLKSDTP